MTKPGRPPAKDSGKKESIDGGDFAAAVEAIGGIEPLDRSKLSDQAPPAQHRASLDASAGDSEPGTAPKSNRDSNSTPGSESVVRATRAEMRRLRAGKIRPQRTVDLHGCSQSNAYSKLCNDIGRAVAEDVRCLLVIHGKGINSPDGRSVLKQALGDWLARPPLVSQVTGCCPAQPADGGDGASYLLLRPE
ncbi:MAG: Smr/MutS family protein [Myxococcales bacterium]|nr:Smr/MutS family protein [Myxococcales bacterium]